MLHSIAGKVLKSSYFWFPEKSGLLQPWAETGHAGDLGQQAESGKGGKKFIFFPFLIFPKQFQNEISTQLEARL